MQSSVHAGSSTAIVVRFDRVAPGEECAQTPAALPTDMLVPRFAPIDFAITSPRATRMRIAVRRQLIRVNRA
jgi:hypothetical protein